MIRLVRLGLLGFGTVGQGVASLIESQRESIALRRGIEFEIVSIGVSDIAKARRIASDRLTTDLDSIVLHPEIDIVIEAMGGLDPAKALVSKALRSGKSVATANKALVSTFGPELLQIARERGLGLRFESTVCAGLPVLAALDRQLAANDFRSIQGILNGTTNLMLSMMALDHSSYEEALEVCQNLGFAEADPSSDVDGWDAAYKISILSSIATGTHLAPDSVRRRGIREVGKEAIHAAAALGGRVRLVAEWVAGPACGNARVEPIIVGPLHPLFSIEGSRNSVVLEGSHCGRIVFVGDGAGGAQTASGLIGDAIELAQSASGTAVPYGWQVDETRYRTDWPDASYALVVCRSGPSILERLEKLTSPLGILKIVETPTGCVALTEPASRTLFDQAMERDGGQDIAQAYRYIS